MYKQQYKELVQKQALGTGYEIVREYQTYDMGQE